MEGNEAGQKKRSQEVPEDRAQDVRWIERCDKHRKQFWGKQVKTEDRGKHNVRYKKKQKWGKTMGHKEENGTKIWLKSFLFSYFLHLP